MQTRPVAFILAPAAVKHESRIGRGVPTQVSLNYCPMTLSNEYPNIMEGGQAHDDVPTYARLRAVVGFTGVGRDEDTFTAKGSGAVDFNSRPTISNDRFHLFVGQFEPRSLAQRRAIGPVPHKGLGSKNRSAPSQTGSETVLVPSGPSGDAGRGP